MLARDNHLQLFMKCGFYFNSQKVIGKMKGWER